MNFRLLNFRTIALASAALSLGACANLKLTYVKPHESLDVALARKPELVRLPAPPVTAAVAGPTGAAMPSVEPALPENPLAERTGEAYSRGEFCMSAGNDDAAIAAFEEAVKIDPTFAEAWQNLAILYEKKGDTKRATDAYKRTKKYAGH